MSILATVPACRVVLRPLSQTGHGGQRRWSLIPDIDPYTSLSANGEEVRNNVEPTLPSLPWPPPLNDNYLLSFRKYFLIISIISRERFPSSPIYELVFESFLDPFI